MFKKIREEGAELPGYSEQKSNLMHPKILVVQILFVYIWCREGYNFILVTLTRLKLD